MMRLGVVSFLNSKPLVEGLSERGDVELVFDVPARLPALLDGGRVDAALIPIVDVIRSMGRLRVVSDACIGCDGETMTVRVFSQIPPDRIRTLSVDGDSHTSIALVTVLWRQLFDRELELRPFDARTMNVDDCESVLLIGDKVVNRARGGFAFEVDLGGAWRQWTGLPFVFAVWAARNPASAAEGAWTGDSPEPAGRFDELFEVLGQARDAGVARGRELAEHYGPKVWWPTDLAIRYLTRCLRYKFDARYFAGANLFAKLCGDCGQAPAGASIVWPEALVAATR